MKSYRADIDGLRTLSVIGVVFYHYFPALVPGGFTGVDVFFVISGYLISSILFREIQDSSFSFRAFYARRFRRLLPSFIFILLCVWFLGWLLLLPHEFANLGTMMAAGGLGVPNILLWQQTGYFDVLSQTKPLLHLWSLGLEEQFYLIWPAALLLMFRFRRGHFLKACLFALFGVSVTLCFLGGDNSATYYLLPFRFWQLLSGAILAYLGEHSFPQKKVWKNLFGCAGFVGILLSFSIISQDLVYPGLWALLPTFSACALIAAGSSAWINQKILGNRGMSGIGLFSYPLYLWHWPIFSLSFIVEGGIPSIAFRWLLVFISLGLGWLTWRFIERPVSKAFALLGADLHVSRSLSFGCAALIALATLGYVTQKTSGFKGSFARPFKKDSIKQEDVKVRSFTRELKEMCAGSFDSELANMLCTSSSEAGSMQFALYGDSHARGLASALKKASEGAIQWHLFTASGCAPLKDTKSFRYKRKSFDCYNFNRKALSSLIKKDSPVSTVLLSSLGPYYMGGTPFAYSHKSMVGGWTLEGSKGLSQAELFVEGYAGTIKALQDAGKLVIFVVDQPELPYDPKACGFEWPLKIFSRAKISCWVEKSRMDERRQSYRDAIAKLQFRFPKLVIFDGEKIFCDKKRCRYDTNGNSLYSDSHHLSSLGTSKVSKVFFEFLLGRSGNKLRAPASGM